MNFGDARLPARYWAKVQPLPFPTYGVSGCWLWCGSRNSKGYGTFNIGTRAGKQITGVAHKMTYELVFGRIRQRGKRRIVVDHLCRTRCCVNPAHLEAVVETTNVARGVSPSAQNARKTHCPAGHEYTPENTYEYDNGTKKYRGCRLCHAAKSKRCRKKNHTGSRLQQDVGRFLKARGSEIQRLSLDTSRHGASTRTGT